MNVHIYMNICFIYGYDRILGSRASFSRETPVPGDFVSPLVFIETQIT